LILPGRALCWDNPERLDSRNRDIRRVFATFLERTVAAGVQSVYEHREREATRRREVLDRARTQLTQKAGLTEYSAPYLFESPYIVDLKSPIRSVMPLVAAIRNDLTSPQRLSRDQVQARLGGALVAANSQEPQIDSYRFTNSDGIIYLLGFDKQGRCVGIRTEPSQFPTDPAYPLNLAAYHGAIQFLQGYDVWICGLLFALFILLRSHRVLIAELLVLAAASRVFMRWPAVGSAPLSAYLEHPSLPWGTAVIMFALTCLVWAYYAKQERSRIRCVVCGYNLAGTAGSVCGECGTPITHEVLELVKLKNSLIGRANTARRLTENQGGWGRQRSGNSVPDVIGGSADFVRSHGP
jgi:hypothetical protein